VSTPNSLDVYRARLRSIQFRLKRRKILAVDLHIAFLPPNLIASPTTYIPLPPPGVENEKHRFPELVPLLVEDGARARWYIYLHRDRPRLRGFARFEDLLRVIDSDTHPFEAGAQGKSVVNFAALSDLQPSRVRVRVLLSCVGIVLPGHLRDPGDVDEIGVDHGIQGLISSGGIDFLAARFDAGVTATGLVDCVFIHIRLPKTDPVKIVSTAMDDGGTYHGTGLMVAKIWSAGKQTRGLQGALISGRG